jgi:WD40 repeat protein
MVIPSRKTEIAIAPPLPRTGAGSGSDDHTVKVWDAASGRCLTSRCLTTLLFSSLHLWVHWQESPTTRLLISDSALRIYIYELHKPRRGESTSPVRRSR